MLPSACLRARTRMPALHPAAHFKSAPNWRSCTALFSTSQPPSGAVGVPTSSPLTGLPRRLPDDRPVFGQIVTFERPVRDEIPARGLGHYGAGHSDHNRTHGSTTHSSLLRFRPCSFTPRSVNGPAAVDHQHVPDDHVGQVARQKQHRADEILGLIPAAGGQHLRRSPIPCSRAVRG